MRYFSIVPLRGDYTKINPAGLFRVNDDGELQDYERLDDDWRSDIGLLKYLDGRDDDAVEITEEDAQKIISIFQQQVGWISGDQQQIMRLQRDALLKRMAELQSSNQSD